MNTVLAIKTIMSNPDVRGGQPIIAGTSVRVTDLAAGHIYRGLSAEELAVNYQLDMGQVHAALAYYFQHRPEMDALIRDEFKKAETLLAKLDSQHRLIRIE